MADQPPPQDPGFQSELERVEGHEASRDIPSPIDPLQAQTAFERRARMEDNVAHVIAVIQTSGFFMLAFAALLGFVDLSNSAAATFLGTVMGYAVAKVDPIMARYYTSRVRLRHPTPTVVGPSIVEPDTPQATPRAS